MIKKLDKPAGLCIKPRLVALVSVNCGFLRLTNLKRVCEALFLLVVVIDLLL
jgi:hypothetical protein